MSENTLLLDPDAFADGRQRQCFGHQLGE